MTGMAEPDPPATARPVGLGRAARTDQASVPAPAPGSPIKRALRAIEILAAGPLTAADAARLLGVNRSTALRLLGELVATGYVARDEAKRYATVPSKFFGLVATREPQVDWSHLVDPVLASIRDDCGEAAMLGVPANGTMVYLAFFPSRHVVAVSEQLGSVRPIHSSALGKAYLSALAPDDLDAELGRLSYQGGTERAARGPIELRGRLDEARRDGYAVDRRETFDGVTGVAVPVRVRGSLIGAAGVSGPADRLDEAAIPGLGERLARGLSDL